MDDLDKVISTISRSVVRGRLAYFGAAADPRFWDDHWRRSFDPRIYESTRKGDVVAFYDAPFRRWLPRDGRILEAGCGFGHHVLALRARGYDAEGVDFAPETIDLVKRHVPDVPVRQSDATALDVSDGYYAGYISLGVVEHREEGPNPYIEEAWRVLAPGGVAIFTVPCFNPFRQWKARRGFYRGSPLDHGFYQYAFSRDEFCELLRGAGFVIAEVSYFDPIKGLKDEIPALGRMLRWRYLGWRLNRLLDQMFRAFPHLSNSLGHMLLVVARKAKA